MTHWIMLSMRRGGYTVSFGPYCKVNKGIVKIDIYYTAEEDGNSFDVFSLGYDHVFVKQPLSPTKHRKTEWMVFKRDIDDLEVRTFYGGNKQFGVYKIVITETIDYIKWIIVLNSCWTVLYFFSALKNKKYVLIGCELGIMMLILLSHAFLYLFYTEDRYIINENRNKKEMPKEKWWTALIDDGSFCADIEEYINDNFKTRDLLIRIKNQIKYTVFHESDGVYFGENGYLYYRSVIDDSEIMNEKMTSGDVDVAIDSLNKFKKYIETRGKKFYFMLPPQKNTAFPERIVTDTVIRQNPNAYEKFIKKINNSTLNRNFVDVFMALRIAEKNYPTYNKTDYHWNHYGATIGYMELVDLISKKQGLGEIYTEEDFEVYYSKDFRGGQLMELNILQDIKENQVRVKKIKGVTMTDIQYDDFFYHYSACNSIKAPLGNLLIIGDSFSEWALQSGSGMFDCFQGVKYVRKNVVENDIDDYIEWADYVIFESIEIDIHNLKSLIDGILDT